MAPSGAIFLTFVDEFVAVDNVLYRPDWDDITVRIVEFGQMSERVIFGIFEEVMFRIIDSFR